MEIPLCKIKKKTNKNNDVFLIESEGNSLRENVSWMSLTTTATRNEEKAKPAILSVSLMTVKRQLRQLPTP